jgi:hypothetical protein
MSSKQESSDLDLARQEIDRLRKALARSERICDEYQQTLNRLLPPPPDDYLPDEAEWVAKANAGELESFEQVVNDVFGKGD